MVLGNTHEDYRQIIACTHFLFMKPVIFILWLLKGKTRKSFGKLHEKCFTSVSAHEICKIIKKLVKIENKVESFRFIFEYGYRSLKLK